MKFDFHFNLIFENAEPGIVMKSQIHDEFWSCMKEMRITFLSTKTWNIMFHHRIIVDDNEAKIKLKIKLKKWLYIAEMTILDLNLMGKLTSKLSWN